MILVFATNVLDDYEFIVQNRLYKGNDRAVLIRIVRLYAPHTGMCVPRAEAYTWLGPLIHPDP